MMQLTIKSIMQKLQAQYFAPGMYSQPDDPSSHNQMAVMPSSQPMIMPIQGVESMFMPAQHVGMPAPQPQVKACSARPVAFVKGPWF
jgi:hypothetical protein